ncbi:MAG: hypothetical protein RL757_2353 [Bacteroidota bacterium]|jgi:hypothetical protein
MKKVFFDVFEYLKDITPLSADKKKEAEVAIATLKRLFPPKPAISKQDFVSLRKKGEQRELLAHAYARVFQMYPKYLPDYMSYEKFVSLRELNNQLLDFKDSGLHELNEICMLVAGLSGAEELTVQSLYLENAIVAYKNKDKEAINAINAFKEVDPNRGGAQTKERNSRKKT